jgi:drug/metabolite transporter (DMT)-like permease
MLFYKLKINLKMLVCIILSIVGVYLVISVNGKMDFSSSMLRGNMLVMGAMVVWVIYTLLNKQLDEAYSSVVLITFQSLSSIVLFVPFVLREVRLWKPLSPVPLFNLIYLGVFCSAFAYFFYIYAAKRLGPTISSAFLNLIPIVSVICGYLILGEKLMPVQIVGMALVMVSLYLLNRKEKAPGTVLQEKESEPVDLKGDNAGINLDI